MDDLQAAELYDSYRQTCSLDPLNSAARANHFYSAIDSKDIVGGFKLLTLHPTADAGFPHTRPPNLICIPAYYNLTNETLIHEALHLHQRRHAPIWDAYFQRQGWMPVAEQHIPERWRRRVRLNPDTLDSRFYAWENQYVPLPLFEREDKPDLRACIVRWWDKKHGSLLSEPPESFVRTFGRNHPQPEHPREVSAVNLARQFRQTDWDSVEAALPNILTSK